MRVPLRDAASLLFEQAVLAEGGQVPLVPLRPADCVGNENAVDRHSIIYCDGFGNAMTGIRAAGHSPAIDKNRAAGPGSISNKSALIGRQ